MISFNVSIISQTKSTLESFKLKVSNINNILFSNSSSLHNECNSLISEYQSHISNAESDRTLCSKVISENYQNISKIELEISDLKYELDRIPNTEENSSAIKALNQEIKDYRSLISIIRNKNKNLESIRTQIGFEIDKYRTAIEKIKNAKKKFDEIHYKIKSEVERALKNIDEGIKISDRAYATVKGVFTSCEVDNSNVLVNYRNNLISKYESFKSERYNILNKLNNLNESIKNIEFLETSSTKMTNIANNIEYYVNEFEKTKDLLTKYINTLRIYEKI